MYCLTATLRNMFQKKRFFQEFHWAAFNGHIEIFKILSPLKDNPNAPDAVFGWTPIHSAAKNGHTEIVNILAPLTDNPNVPNNDGITPIQEAARYGHAEIVKILAPLTENPNAPDYDGRTPIHWATQNGHTEIVKLIEYFQTSKKCNAGASSIEPNKKRAKKFQI